MWLQGVEGRRLDLLSRLANIPITTAAFMLIRLVPLTPPVDALGLADSGKFSLRIVAASGGASGEDIKIFFWCSGRDKTIVSLVEIALSRKS